MRLNLILPHYLKYTNKSHPLIKIGSLFPDFLLTIPHIKCRFLLSLIQGLLCDMSKAYDSLQ